MTKMMDILEEFLIRKRFRFFRLDGSCNIADRRDMVNEFQTNPEIFAFILSTRAGGLGVTLTAADTVIFYDNDWNPTVDSQAADRAHRIGQQCDVEVFRLVLKDTIETRILKRAQQKQNVQATVYSGETFKAEVFQPQEVMKILFDEAEAVDMSAADAINASLMKESNKEEPSANQEGQESNQKLNSFMNKGHLRRGKIQKTNSVGIQTGFSFKSEKVNGIQKEVKIGKDEPGENPKKKNGFKKKKENSMEIENENGNIPIKKKNENGLKNDQKTNDTAEKKVVI